MIILSSDAGCTIPTVPHAAGRMKRKVEPPPLARPSRMSFLTSARQREDPAKVPVVLDQYAGIEP